MRDMALPRLSAGEALAIRMRSLLLRDVPEGPRHATDVAGVDVAGVVEWLGAMQAQDDASVLWSLGCRLPGSTAAGVERALESRQAIRTWPMRGTLHLVPARDAAWMVALLARRPLARSAGRRAQLGITEDTARRAMDVLAGALAGGGRRTRAECVDALAAAGLPTAGQGAYHLLAYASQCGLTCLAPDVGGEQTVVLLDEWAPDQRRPDADEALATVASRYFRGRGPATRADLAAWTGMTATETARAVAAAGDGLERAVLDDSEVYVAAGALESALDARHADAGRVDALAGFDEYLLGYRDRTLMVDPHHMSAVVPGGGTFRWPVVRDGRVVATWGRRRVRTGIAATVRPLDGMAAAERVGVADAVAAYARFVDRPLDVRWDEAACVDGAGPGRRSPPG